MKSSRLERVSKRPTVLLPSVTKVDDFCVNTLASLRDCLAFNPKLDYCYEVRGIDHRTGCLRYTIKFNVNGVLFTVNAYVSTKVRDVTYPFIHRIFTFNQLVSEIITYFRYYGFT